MIVVLDTNVLISGIFFKGTPHDILRAWRHGAFDLAVSGEIVGEYVRVAAELNLSFPDVDISSILELIVVRAEMFAPPPLPELICRDLDDDKFLACALASGAEYIISGDKDLLALGSHSNVQITSPRDFWRLLKP